MISLKKKNRLYINYSPDAILIANTTYYAININRLKQDLGCYYNVLQIRFNRQLIVSSTTILNERLECALHVY